MKIYANNSTEKICTNFKIFIFHVVIANFYVHQRINITF